MEFAAQSKKFDEDIIRELGTWGVFVSHCCAHVVSLSVIAFPETGRQCANAAKARGFIENSHQIRHIVDQIQSGS